MTDGISQKIKGGEKSICPSCVHRDVCKAVDNQPCIECTQWKPTNKTRFGRIQSMSAEEFAKWLDEEFGRASWCDVDALIHDDCDNKPCVECIVRWLNEEAK